MLTGVGFPLTSHRRAAPVELEKRIKGDGVLTNFGPINMFSLCLILKVPVALAPKEHAERQQRFIING